MKKTWTIAAFMLLGLLYVHDLKSQVVVQPVFQAVQYTAQLPVISTVEPTQVSANMAIGGGIISHDGGAPLIAGGLVWSTTNFPSVEENEGITYDGTALGVFTSTMTELSSNTVYYVRAYATNIAGTAYGEEFGFITEGSDVFICGDPLVDARDGQSYATIQIGAQCWMAENLNVGTMIQGNQNQTDNGTIEKYCYNNSESNCETYGGLYQWNEAMAYSTTPGSQGICPEGWYIPNDAEWTALTDLLGGEAVAGAAMKEAGTTHWFAPNTGATNSSGYTGLPAGNRGTDGSFSNMAFFGNFWTSTQSNDDNAWRRFLSFNSEAVNRSDISKQTGFSIRCRKDDSPQLDISPTSQTVHFDAGTASFAITSNTSWTVTGNADWFIVEPSSGSNNALLTVIFEFNESAEPRSGEITLTAAGGSPVKTASITQEGYVWSCGYPIEDERDGQVYNTVLIGDQCWLAENLNFGQMIQSTSEQTDNGVFEKYCYINQVNNCDIYGGLYQWHEMMQYHAGVGLQGVCPEGWHLPAGTEWNALLTELGGATLAGGKMKTTGTIEDQTGLWYAPNTGATNSSGLSVLPAGTRLTEGNTLNLGHSSFLWSTTHVGENVLTVELAYDSQEVFLVEQESSYGYSVRCVKDEEAHTFLMINNASADFTAEGGEAEFTIASNTNWTLTNIPEWLSVDPAAGSGNGQFALTCESNAITEPRSATLNLEAGGNTVELYVSQEAFVVELVVEPESKHLPYSAGAATFEVFSNTTWIVIENESWFEVTPLTGSNNETLTLSYDDNPSSDMRTGQFVVMDTNGDFVVSLIITQVAYGAVVCGEPLIDIRDGQVYATVQIGDQCWMAENLNIGTRISGNINQTDNGIIEKYCYDNSEENCNVYGALYQWEEMMNYTNTPGVQGICPVGWRIPTDYELTVLTDYMRTQPTYLCYGNTDYIAKALATKTNWNYSPLTCAVGNYPHHNNASGFSFLPGGYRSTGGNFFYLGDASYWWSSTESTGANSWSRMLGTHTQKLPSRMALSKNSGYYVRCLMGVESTSAVLPTITTAEVASVTSYSATSGGNVIDDGGAPVTMRGVCFSTSQNPTIEDNITTDGNGTGEFTSVLQYLAPETTYYARAYATNSEGTAYGEEFSFTTTVFTCGEPFTDLRDGQSYATIQIGSRCWMAENLNIGTQINGSSNQTDNGIIEKYCHDNNNQNCNIYGGLYQWNEMMQYNSTPGVQGICPNGWHLPTDDEWAAFLNYVRNQPEYRCNNNSTYIAKALAATTHWNSHSNTCAIGNDLNANNATGFAALPAGERHSNGSFIHINNERTFFWSSSESEDTEAWVQFLRTSSALVSQNSRNQSLGLSVRCLMDAVLPTVTTKVLTGITYATAISGGTVANDGGAEVTARGVCWSASQTPTVEDNVTINGSDIGDFVSILTGLTPETTYYIRAYATNVAGTAYGEELSFTTGEVVPFNCGDYLIDPRDGQPYETVQIGIQCWMAQNLNVGTLINSDINQSDNAIIEKYCYSNSEDNCDVYGGLYQWDEMMGYTTTVGVQGICPEGWHIPADAEWTQLTNYLDTQGFPNSSVTNGAGNALKSCRQVNSPLGGDCDTSEHPRWNSHDTHHGFDEFGFSAIPGGSRNINGNFNNIGNIGTWWSSDEDSYTHALYRSIYRFNGSVNPFNNNKVYGFSVRCLKDPVLPAVTTSGITGITASAATSGGNVTNVGGAEVTTRGVSWSTSQSPTIEDNITEDGTGTGEFVSLLTDLIPETTYYVRAYATNTVGTAYGEEVSFTTGQVTMPAVTTMEAANITSFAATSGGNVTGDGNAEVTARGVCWSTSQTPTIEDNITSDGIGTGEFFSLLTGLIPETTYYVRAYATNSIGTAYGEEFSFTTKEIDPFICGDPLVDARDGQSYATVQIGAQCWMAENLNAGTMIQGNQNQTDNGTIEKHCYNNSESNCETYGGLYQWNEAMAYSTTPGSQGICPEGWYIPNDAEWTALTDLLGGEAVAGAAMKEAGTTHWFAPNTGATNSSGYTGLPGGNRGIDGSFSNMAFFGNFWTSTPSNEDDAWRRFLSFNSIAVNRIDFNKQAGFSVRCRKDDSPQINITPTSQTVSFDAGTATLLITSNTSWTVTENTEWFTVEPSSGENNALLTVSYTFNESAEPRSGEITLTAAGGSPVITASITQEGYVWSCGYPIEDERDGQVYNTVQIGNHCWLAENLNLGQRIHNSVGQTDNGIFQKYCYANLESNCDIYGGLYQWNEMMQYHAGFGLQGICPEGWHLPEQAKWNALVTELGGAPLAGGKMKATGTIEDETGLWYAPNTGADNSSGLSVFPAGERIPGGSTANLGYSSILWSTTHVGENVLTNELTNDSQEIFLNQQEKGYGYSVRCVKDEEAHTFLQINTAWKAFSYEGGEAEFSITSNTNWTLTNIPEWLSVDTTTASGDSQFTLTCEYNPLTEPRVATLNLEANDNVIELHITQEPFVAELTINPPYKAVPYTAFTTTFEVLSNTSWVVIENESWFDVTPLSGSNNGTLTLNHQENTTSEKRTGQFIVLDTSANILITVMIIQVSSGEINCGEQLVDSRDGQSYATIQIGNQCWMTENLAYLPQVSPSSQGNQVDPYYYVYNYQGTNVNTAKGTANYQNYGVLYNAPASTTACPDGWYLPKDTDWALLIDYVVSLGYLNVSGDANGTANALKSCRQVNSPLGDPCNTSEHPRWNSHGTHHGFDEFGFSALPGGQRRLAGNFNHLGEISNWWSSTIISHTHARVWEMYWDRGGVNKPTTSKSFGASIRCISNESAYAVAPFVTTTPVSEITPTTAISGGDIAFDGGAQITARGVCWSTEPNPTIEDNITTGGTGLGWFTSELTGLTPETTYYVRAYATNIAGAGYGEEFSFTTDQLFEPTITTAQVSAVTPYSATSGGDVTDDGNATVTARGVVWSTSVHPTIETYEGITTDGLGLGEFVSQITGLTPETTYFVRAYATNIGGTAYGEELSFTTADLSAFACGEPVTDLRDGQSYETVQIGDQCWMKGNLKYLPSVVGPGNSSQTSPYHYVYDYNGVDVNAAKASANFNKYGVLYNWPASLSACPFGWGLPSDDDWDELTDYLETQGFPNENVADGAGNSLKSCRQVNSPLGGDCSTSEHPRWNSNNTHHGFDEFDFFALPGGMRNTFDVFGGIGRGSYWWSSTAYSSSFSYSRSIRHEQGNVSHGAGSKSLGLSVRCLYVLSVPSVTTSQVNQITANTGIVVGNVTDDGNDQVITRGVVWSSSVNPTIENNEGITTEGDDLGEFISQVTGLSPETTYYVRAYATNILGAGYGDALSFTTPEIGSFACGDDITFTYRGEQVTYGTVPLGILCWLDRNMGASRVPASMTDSEGFGDLFQWGRLDDGHQDRQSNTTPGPINHDVPGHDEFLTLDEDPWDWRSPQNNDLWQGVNGINNPCPDGWRVPTETELNAQRQSWSSNNSAGAYASTLKWPVGGYRGSNGTFNHVGSFGIVWSSSVSGANARLLYFNSGDAVMSNLGRAGGMCVRCVRD